MVSKCANPICPARFHFLHEGRIFTVVRAPQQAGGNGAQRRVEHYWLCEACARTMTLVCRGGQIGVHVTAPEPKVPKSVLSESSFPPATRTSK